MLEKKNKLLERNRKLECKSTASCLEQHSNTNSNLRVAAARKKAEAAKRAAEEALADNNTTMSEELFRKQTAQNTSLNRKALAAQNVPKNIDVKDYAANAAAPAKKSVHKSDAAAAPVTVDSATADGTEKKKKKKKKPKPTYNLAGALSKGENIPGMTDKHPKPAAVLQKAKAQPSRPAQAAIGSKATSMPTPDQIEALPRELQKPQASAKKAAVPEKKAKKEKTYLPGAEKSTEEFQNERKKQEIQQRMEARRQGLSGKALDSVGNLGQGALGTVDQLGQNLPVGSKAVSGATRVSSIPLPVLLLQYANKCIGCREHTRGSDKGPWWYAR